MNPYWFFFSYSRLDRDPYLKKFYNDLVDNVRLQVGGTREQVGFLDSEDVELGQEWPEALARAIQTTQVFVPIYTPSYFASEFCGREWQVIEDRRQATEAAGGPGRPPVILPVLWIPQDKLPTTLPEVASELQYAHEEFGDLYVKEGLWLLMKLNKYRDVRRELIDRLAGRIIEVARKHPLSVLSDPPLIRQVPSAFHPKAAIAAAVVPNPAHVGPRYVQFLFVAGRRAEFELQHLRQKLECYGPEGGMDWQPYLPDMADEIAILAMGAAASEKLRYEAVPLGSDLIERLDAAQRENKIVAIVVDTWSLRLDQYEKLMLEYDKRLYPNCAVLIPWNLNDEETKLTEEKLRSVVQLTFMNRLLYKDPTSFIDTIRSPADLKTSLGTALNAARMRILNVAEVKKRAESQHVFPRPILQNSPEIRA